MQRWAKDKGKVPPGCLWADHVVKVTKWSMPLESSLLHNAAKLLTLSFTYMLWCSAFTDTTDIFSEMCPLKNTDFCLFCTINHTQFTGLKPANPWMENQHSKHAATPTCSNMSWEKSPTKLTYRKNIPRSKYIVLYNKSYTILQGPHRMAGIGVKPASPRWESRHFNPAAKVTCFKAGLDYN